MTAEPCASRLYLWPRAAAASSVLTPSLRTRALRFLAVTLRFSVQYPEDYPEVLPEMELEPVEGEWENDEHAEMMADLKSVVRAVLPSASGLSAADALLAPCIPASDRVRRA